MNAIEISAIGIIVCTVVNFIFFILALFLTLTVQNWKNDISKDMKILALDKKRKPKERKA